MALANEPIYSGLKIETTIVLNQLDTEKAGTGMIRLDPKHHLIYILNSDQNVLWQFSEKGDVLAKLALDELLIHLPVKVKGHAVRVGDIWPLGKNSLLLAEGNTASLYMIDMSGQIHKKISLKDSPTGLIVVSQDTFVVFHENFSGKFLSLLTSTGEIVFSLQIDDSQFQPSGIGMKVFLSRAEYFIVNPRLFFVSVAGRNQIVKCEVAAYSLKFESITLPKSNCQVYNMGFDAVTQILWFIEEAEKGKYKYYEMSWQMKKVIKQKEISDSFVNRGFQYFANYYEFEGKTLKRYGYR
jgi:hypothetical protein